MAITDLTSDELWILAKSKPEFLRQECLNNEFFLATSIIGKDFTEEVHKPIFDNFFIKKDSSKPIEEQEFYTSKDSSVEEHPVKRHLLLMPRGAFKSTANVIDVVDWIIHFPHVRILILTATLPLAKAFVREVKEIFTIRGGRPTLFQTIFPEFCFKPSKRQFGPKNEFLSPACTRFDKKEPTVWAESADSEATGQHCDLLISDDINTPETTNTAIKVEAAKRKYYASEILVDPYCYANIIGTPQTPDDILADVQKRFGSEELKVYRKPAMWVKPEYEAKAEEERTKNDYNLLFEKDRSGRKRLTWEFLQAKKKANPELFRSQYLLDPHGIAEIKFDVELLQHSTVSWSLVPSNLKHYIAWDLAYKQGANRNYMCGTIGGVDDEYRLYVVEIYRDQYSDWEKACKIAETCKLYNPEWIFIENTHGAEFLKDAINRRAIEIGVDNIFSKLVFFKTDTRKGAKELRVGSLEAPIRTGKLKLVSSISDIQEVYREFNLFGTSSAIPDDIPDSIAHLYTQLHTSGQLISRSPRPVSPEAVQHAWNIAQQKQLDELLFGGDIEVAPIELAPVQDDSGPVLDVRDYWSTPKK